MEDSIAEEEAGKRKAPWKAALCVFPAGTEAPEQEKEHPDRDARVRDVENREAPHLEVIRNDAVPEAIDDIREAAAEDETESGKLEAGSRKPRSRCTDGHDGYRDESRDNQRFLQPPRQFHSEGDPRIPRILESRERAEHRDAGIEERVREDCGKETQGETGGGDGAEDAHGR